MPRITLGNISLHYEQTGAAQAEQLVFVNGLTMDTSAWYPLQAELGDYHCTLYDCRGQGKSDKPAGPYLPQQHVADLKALLDALDLHNIHLVGLSNGGLVAILLAGQLALSEPDRLKSVTVIDSFITADALLRSILKSWRAALDCGGAGLRFDVATPWVWGHAFLARFEKEVLAFRAKAEASDPQAIGALIDGLVEFDSASASLEAFAGPLLVMVGEDDVLTPPRHSYEIATTAQRAQLVTLAHTGHAAPVENASEVAAHLKPFIASVSKGEA